MNTLPGMPNLFAGAEQAKDFAIHQVHTIVDAIKDVRDAVDALDTREETVWRHDETAADAGGVAVVTFEGPRQGFAWRIERLSLVVNGGVGSIGALYRGQVQPSFAVFRIDDADFFADAVGGDGIHIPTGVPAILRLTGCPPGAAVNAAMQIVETEFPE